VISGQGAGMADLNFTDDAHNLLETVLTRRPRMTQARLRPRIERAVRLLLMEQGARTADVETVKEALRLVMPRSMEGTFERLADPAANLTFRAAMTDLDAYYALPRPVRRWPSVRFTPEKPPAETNVMAISASPRLHGNTAAMVDAALAGAAASGARTEKINLCQVNYKYCISCRKCKEPDYPRYCSIDDDMTALYPRIAAADAFILGFPVYSESHCGQLAAFFDRWDPFFWRKFGDKRVMLIAGWGGPGAENYDHVMEHVMFILKIHQIETVEPIAACRLIGKRRGLDEDRQAIISHYPEELDKIYRAGENLVTGNDPQEA
jgi:multimeric flavodoxin WrbA